MIETTVRITNELGLHARAAAKLVRLTGRFKSDIKFSRLNSDQQVDGKSILGVLMLAASCGTDLRLQVSGDDEAEATQNIEALFQERFGEAR